MTPLLARLVLSASAQSCPNIAEQVAAARAAYDNVEMDQARAALTAGLAAVSCQASVVDPKDLLALYHTSALVALTLDDREGVLYAVLRAVAADHTGGRPGDTFPPELQQQFDTWASRLGATLITLRVDGGGIVYVDGRTADAARPLDVAQGEHVLQIDALDGSPVRTEVRELSADTLLSTGLPMLAPPVPDPEPVVPVPVPLPVPQPVAHRRRPALLWLGSAAAAGGATFLVSSAFLSERNFLASKYAATSILGCSIDRSCYLIAREDAIRTDATRIRAAYVTGYGLSVVSGGLLVTAVVGLPPRK